MAVELNADERLFIENAIRRRGISAANGRLLCARGEVDRKFCTLGIPRGGVALNGANDGLGKVRDLPRNDERFESAILTTVHYSELRYMGG